MDGTLTPPRESIDTSVLDAMSSLFSLEGVQIGIVSGSPYYYIDQQISNLLQICPSKTSIMPCNGTQLFEWDKDLEVYNNLYETDMKSFMGEKEYSHLVRHVLELQLQFVNENLKFYALTGQFISYRKSMLNWAMVGRDAESSERTRFIDLDQSKNIRMHMRDALRVRLDTSGIPGIDLNLGGSTSIDIHPNGWDKTHALRHCTGDVWFVGDKCTPGGNDYSLWKKLGANKGFSTTGPKETIRIINEIIIPGIQGA